MPMPYGLLPHELIEILDNDRILPGISQLFKLGEDFPFLNYYNVQSLEANEINMSNVNWHQRALLFDPQPTFNPLVKLLKLYKQKTTPSDQLLTFKDFHNIRYTFINNLFHDYKQTDDKFQKHLVGLKSWFVWNIYKQLSCLLCLTLAAQKQTPGQTS